MSADVLFAYVFVCFLCVISPGPAVFLAIYNGAVNGSKVVVVSALGNIIGLMFLSILSAGGLSALLLASSTLFSLVKFTGAAYLIYLGVRQLRSVNKTTLNNTELTEEANRSLDSYFKEGFFVAATNPKPIIFFTALFPQFLDTSSPVLTQFMLMTVIFMTFSFLSLSTYGYLAQRANGLMSNINNAKWFHRISGGLFVGMGASILFIKREG
ncbi:threonine/homoserine/homoserine lactone efflux protein [Sinobacterium caligoides]|uniref:Threonine/homoserine/homoserine lactone efflux protein n=1 Tax=Sinobacterium caligoides TaxID=933926 RepID=A0A3N2E025_9GAMM|nr:LysE family translocator [Sinobacterium caligoides]ROS05434.1 threonine/homoserine/homoserine lactone efflux protein [Sinobacterium caligoides]